MVKLFPSPLQQKKMHTRRLNFFYTTIVFGVFFKVDVTPPAVCLFVCVPEVSDELNILSSAMNVFCDAVPHL